MLQSMSDLNPDCTIRRESVKIICAWCDEVIGEKEGDGVTHGICPACAERLKIECTIHGQEECARCS